MLFVLFPRVIPSDKTLFSELFNPLKNFLFNVSNKSRKLLATVPCYGQDKEISEQHAIYSLLF